MTRTGRFWCRFPYLISCRSMYPSMHSDLLNQTDGCFILISLLSHGHPQDYLLEARRSLQINSSVDWRLRRSLPPTIGRPGASSDACLAARGQAGSGSQPLPVRSTSNEAGLSGSPAAQPHAPAVRRLDLSTLINIASAQLVPPVGLNLCSKPSSVDVFHISSPSLQFQLRSLSVSLSS